MYTYIYVPALTIQLCLIFCPTVHYNALKSNQIKEAFGRRRNKVGGRENRSSRCMEPGENQFGVVLVSNLTIVF